MSVLLVGDYRDRLNWGARGASTALSQIIRGRHRISDTISGLEISKRTPIYNGLGYLPFTGRIREKIYPRNIPSVLSALIGRRDFISADPVESVENIRKYSSRHPELRDIIDSVKRADRVVINGEGSMIFKTPASSEYMYQLAMIELAHQMNTPVFHVNALVSDPPGGERNEQTVATTRVMMEKCAAVTLRDPVSYEYLSKISPKANTFMVPDSLFAWNRRVDEASTQLPSDGNYLLPFNEAPDEYFDQLNFEASYICLSGSSTAAKDQEASRKRYTALAEALKHTNMNVFLVPTCYGDRFLYDVAETTGLPVVPLRVPILAGAAILANARLLVSGRFHPSIMAALGGTPCIFLGADSHKTRSLQGMLEYTDVRTFADKPSDKEIDEIIDLSSDYLEQNDMIRSRVKDLARGYERDALRLQDIIN